MIDEITKLESIEREIQDIIARLSAVRDRISRDSTTDAGRLLSVAITEIEKGAAMALYAKRRMEKAIDPKENINRKRFD